MDEIRDLRALMMAHGCLLSALAVTHPEPLRLLEQFLAAQKRMEACLIDDEDFEELLVAFREHATTVEGAIPV
jgi:hypothetical protein